MMSESAIFNAAVKLPPAERTSYLDQACGDNADLRRDVESLIVAHEGDRDFLRQPALDRATQTEEFKPVTEGPGTRIGPYKLLQKIGEGGFGIVFMAEQDRPVCRKVALKIIKPGMDTAQVI